MPHLATQALHSRGLTKPLSNFLRTLVALICVSGAIFAWTLFDSFITCLSFSFACMCISAILACDLLEHIIPTEFVAIFSLLAIVFRYSLEGIAGVTQVGLPAACIAGVLMLLNCLRTKQFKPEIIGSGDVRMIIPLALFCGYNGIGYGLFAAYLLLFIFVVLQLIIKRAKMHTNIALAPGLVAWFFFGTLIPFLLP